MSDPTLADEAERELLDAESCMRRAAAMFHDCPLSDLLRFADDVAPSLVAIAKAVVEQANDQAGMKMDDDIVTVQGIEWGRSKPPPSRTGWRKEELLEAVLDSRLVDPDTGAIADESPLERVLHVWNLGEPRSTALAKRGLNGDEFCHVTWPEQKPWRVIPVARKRGR